MNTPTVFTFTNCESPSAGSMVPRLQAELEPLLDGVQLSDALVPLLHHRPCIRTLQRWVGSGMPHHLRPSARPSARRARRWFLLSEVYAWLKVDGDLSVVRHLYVDRVDFCTFGNSTPFRVRIVNAYNDNQDYFYVKKADASRIYGIELEHLLSPNRLNFLTHGTTLIEEHIAGIPGDMFIANWLGRRPELKPIRVAKELVKFNERCFVRLLGDMRSYNFVFVLTPDFEEAQVRIRAMDFDQQSYDGRKNFYLPQFFKDNSPLVRFCAKHLRPETAAQYRREEQTLILHRATLASERLGLLLHDMANDPLAPLEKVYSLREGLAEHYHRDDYLRCESMGALIRQNLESIRRDIGRPVVPELVPE